MKDLNYMKSQKAHRRRKSLAIRRMKSLSMAALTPSQKLRLRSTTQSAVASRSFRSRVESQAYGYVSLIGQRAAMEDAVTAAPPGWPKADYSFFAVYDGHGGAGAAEKCRKGMHVCLEKEMEEEIRRGYSSFVSA